MEKKTKRIISIIALTLFVVTVFGLSGCGKTEEKAEPVQIFSCLPSEIAKYTVYNEDENYTLIKNEDVWELENNDVAVLKQDEVTKIVNGASVLTAQEQLSEKDLDGYEAVENQKVEIHLTDGTSYSFEFVGINGANCAVLDAKTNQLYRMSLSVRDTMIVPLDRFRELLVYEDLKETKGALTSFNLVNYDDERFVVRQKTASEISQKPSNKYYMESPYKRDVDDHLFEQQIGVKIPQIAIAKYVDDFPEDWSIYGLDKKSRAELTFVWGDVKHTLYFGKNENGMVYATKADSDSIFLINAARLEFLDVDPFFVLDTRVIETEPKHIKSITARKDGVTYKLRCTAPGTETALYYVNGKAASQYSFDIAANALGEIKLLNELLTVPKKKNAIEIDITYGNRQRTQRLSFVPINDKEYALFINNTAEFAVDKLAVDSLFAELETISNNPMQTGEKG